MKKLTGTLLSVAVCASLASAVQFEAPKDTSSFDGVELNFKADLAFTYQVLDQSYTPLDKSTTVTNVVADTTTTSGYALKDVTTKGPGTEVELKPGLVLPTANLDVYGKVMSGFNVLLQNRLASHHHTEFYVKGGYATIDNLDFISKGFAADLMKYTTIKVGVNDINFGDTQYTRTDNASKFKSAFVHNLAVESAMEGPFLEVLYRIPTANMFVMGGVTTGQENPSTVTKDYKTSAVPAVYAKVGYDNQLNDALRVRVNGSVFYTNGNGYSGLFGASKAGEISEDILGDAGQAGSAWGPMGSYADLLATKFHAFVKYNNTEISGLLEFASSDEAYGKKAIETSPKDLTHYALDVVQRFGNDKYYAAARYENATLDTGAANDAELTQYQLALGWYLSDNAMAKVEYIKQERTNLEVDSRGAGHTSAPAQFDGFMISTALTF